MPIETNNIYTTYYTPRSWKITWGTNVKDIALGDEAPCEPLYTPPTDDDLLAFLNEK